MMGGGEKGREAWWRKEAGKGGWGWGMRGGASGRGGREGGGRGGGGGWGVNEGGVVGGG